MSKLTNVVGIVAGCGACIIAGGLSDWRVAAVGVCALVGLIVLDGE